MFSFSYRTVPVLRMFFFLVFSIFLQSQALAEEDYLPPTAAFKFSASMLDAQTVGVTFQVANGYYLYRERLKFVATGAKLGSPQLPAGKVKYDETFEKDVETYRNTLQIKIPVEGSGPFTLAVTSQGCADAGLCYPPMESVAKLIVAAVNAGGNAKTGAKNLNGNSGSASTASSAPVKLDASTNAAKSLSSALAEMKAPSAATSSPVKGQNSASDSAASAATSAKAASKEKAVEPAASAASPASVNAANPASAIADANALIAAAIPKSSSTKPLPVVSAEGDAAPIAVPPPLTVEAVVSAASDAPASANIPNKPAAASSAADAESNRVADTLKGGKLLLIMPLFFGIGLALSFTPCVLPMVPILSFIIVGEGAAVSRMRGFVLSLSYVMGMAIVYTMLGVASGLAGEGLSAALQNPWVLGAFGLLLAGFSLAMFDVYQLQMPASIQEKLITTSERQGRGKLFGVFVMGAISALIVGPCVTAPLFGTLVYISQTGDAFLGGAALFAMALGMGLPLILMGVSAGSLLPKAGAWMDAVKKFFGVLLLGVALWIVAPVLPAAVQMLGWTLLLIGYGVYLLRGQGQWVAKSAGLIFTILGALQLVGVATGGRDPYAPLAHLQAAGAQGAIHFQRIKTSADLDAVLAANRGKIVMLDFYADWCVSCKEMEKLTFPDPKVKAKMANMLLLQVDVTANDEADKAMLKRFHLFGPPGIIFFDRLGNEIESRRVVGYQNASRFAESLDAVL